MTQEEARESLDRRRRDPLVRLMHAWTEEDATEQRLRAYLDAHAHNAAAREQAWAAWCDLRDALPNLEVPDCGTYQHGQVIILFWTCCSYHAELEVSDGLAEFYCRAPGGAYTDGDYGPGEPIPGALLDHLRHFAAGGGDCEF